MHNNAIIQEISGANAEDNILNHQNTLKITRNFKQKKRTKVAAIWKHIRLLFFQQLNLCSRTALLSIS